MKKHYLKIAVVILLLIFGVQFAVGWGGVADRMRAEFTELRTRFNSNRSDANRDVDLPVPGMNDCVVVNGLRYKVITVQHGVRCSKTPNGSELNGDALRLFTELFVMSMGPTEEEPEWYLVSRSPRAEHTIGYVNSELVEPWPTRLANRPRKAVDLYANQEDAIELAKTGSTRGKPIGRIEADKASAYLPWPIVETSCVTNKYGQIVEVQKLHLLGVGGTNSSAKPSFSEHDLAQMIDALGVMTVAFCVDNTKSTEPYLPAICEFLQRLARQMHYKNKDLQLALTTYRDDVEGLRFASGVTKVEWNGETRQLGAFVSGVKKLSVPDVGSEEWAECGLQGLLDVICKTEWPELSHPTVVWIGDNSFHPWDSPKNSKQKYDVNVDGNVDEGNVDKGNVDEARVIEEARKRGITVHAVCINGGGGPAEQKLHREQCERIASKTGGKVYGLDDVELLIGEIGKAFDFENSERAKNQEEVEKVTKGDMSTREFREQSDQSDLFRRYRIIRILENAGIKFEDLAPGRPVFVSGWVATQLPGNEPDFERMVFLSRIELDILLAELNHMVAFLNLENSKDVYELFWLGLGSRVGDNSFFSQKMDDQTEFDNFINSLGIPLRTGITSKTRAEIMAMSRDDKRVLKQRLIRDLIPRLNEARSKNIFDHNQNGGFDFGWVPESLLP